MAIMEKTDSKINMIKDSKIEKPCLFFGVVIIQMGSVWSKQSRLK